MIIVSEIQQERAAVRQMRLAGHIMPRIRKTGSVFRFVFTPHFREGRHDAVASRFGEFL
jgi:hypothetical protein